MTVAQLIEELQKFPQDAPVRVTINCAHDAVWATLGEVEAGYDEGDKEVRLNGWAANTRMIVEVNDQDGAGDEEEDEDEDLDDEEDEEDDS